MQKKKKDYSKMTNEELLRAYDDAQEDGVTVPLMTEMMDRFAWYISKAEVQLYDTAEETYKRS